MDEFGETGFQGLVETYTNYVYALTYRILGNADDAADATQETLFKLYRNAHKFNAEREIRNWVCTIALNTARDIYRKRKRHHGEIEYDEGSHAAEGESARSEPEAKLLAAEMLKALPIDLREAMVLFYIEQRSIKEIAALLKRPEILIKVRLHRARTRLLKKFGESAS